MVEKTIAHYGRLDVQVNNAGYEGPNAAITDQSMTTSSVSTTSMYSGPFSV